MAETIAHCAIGPGTSVTVGTDVVYTKGGVQAGMEGDIAFATVDQLSAPFASRIVNKQLVLKGTSAEAAESIIQDVWGEVAAASLGLPTTVTPATETVSAVFPTGDTFTITEGVACDFGELASDESDANTLGFTFKGISSDGTTAQGSYAEPA